VLKESGRGNAGGRRARWMSATMVVVELALTVVLLVGAGLMVRSFLKLYTLDMGYASEHLMTMRLQLLADKYQDVAARRAFFDRLLPQVASVPGVEDVALTTSLPPFGAGARGFDVEGRPVRAAEQAAPEMTTVSISPRFFDVLKVPLRRGRAFTDRDGLTGDETAIINERAAAKYFAGQDPIGQRIRFVTPPPVAGQPALPAQPWRTIVGISATVRHSSPQESEPDAVVYVPHRQDVSGSVMLTVRSRSEPATIMRAVQREVQGIDQDQPVFTVQTVDEMLKQSMWPYRVFGSLFAIFAAIGLLLSAVGLYAVMAYSVTQRRQEIGVRMALGAQGSQVSWLVLRRGLIQLAIGLTLGLAGAVGLSRVLRTLLVQISPNDPLTFIAITTLLAAVAVAACLIPARRATRIDPLVALRVD
jgi:putative ABC transport system permease protein